MKRVLAKFMPKLLVMEQMQLRVEVSQDMLRPTNSDSNFINTVITTHGSWVYMYDSETKLQSSQWKDSKQPRPKKACYVRTKVKAMLNVFFDFFDVVHHKFAPQG